MSGRGGDKILKDQTKYVILVYYMYLNESICFDRCVDSLGYFLGNLKENFGLGLGG